MEPHGGVDPKALAETLELPVVQEGKDYEPSDDARRSQKLIEQIEERRQRRARLVADRNRRAVELERAAKKSVDLRDETLEAIRSECFQREVAENNRHSNLVQTGNLELSARDKEVAALDVSLAQLRKQLDAELNKLDPERKGGV